MATKQRASECLHAIKVLNKKDSKLESQFSIISNSLNQTFKDYKPSLISLFEDVAKNEQVIPGFPGSQYNFICKFSQILEQFIDNLHSDDFKGYEEIDQLHSLFNNVKQSFHSILNVKDLLSIDKDLEKKIQKLTKKINDKVDTKPSKVTSKLYEMMEEIRVETLMPQRLAVLKAASLKQDDFKSSIDAFLNYIFDRFALNQNVIDKKIQFNNKLSAHINEMISHLENDSEMKIHYKEDMKSFLNIKKMIRYDMICEEFEPIEVNYNLLNEKPPVFPNELHSIIYPISMAKAEKNFSAEYSNEISLRKGKIILLMEPPDTEWVLATNPFSRASGYVPSSHISIIKGSLAVVLKEISDQNGNLQKGDYIVANPDPKNDNYFRCFTVMGNELLLRKNQVALISDPDH